MNDLSGELPRVHHCCNPLPPLSLCILITLLFFGLAVSIFILIAVHNAAFLVSLLLLSLVVLAFLLWNTLNWTRNGAIFRYLQSFPDSDLHDAREGQLVKITGIVSCGNVSLESSYEKASRCIYTSTLLYEYFGLGLKPMRALRSCFQWKLAYSERYSSDFYLTDQKSGIRAIVKVGSGCKVIPLVVESRLVNTRSKCRILSPNLRKWLTERNLSPEPRLLRLEEGYIKEGSSATVVGMLHRNNGILMIVQPPELVSTGWQWRKLLLPVDIDGLILGVPEMASHK